MLIDKNLIIAARDLLQDYCDWLTHYNPDSVIALDEASTTVAALTKVLRIKEPSKEKSKEKKLIRESFKTVWETYLEAQICYLRGSLDYDIARDIATGKYKPLRERDLCKWYSDLSEDDTYKGIIITKGKKVIFRKIW